MQQVHSIAKIHPSSHSELVCDLELVHWLFTYKSIISHLSIYLSIYRVPRMC